MPHTSKNKLHWPPAVTVDVVIFTIEDDELKVLLVRRAKPPFQGSWAVPGGFLLRDETTKQAALRVLEEKAGVKNVYVEQLYTFDSPSRDPRGHVLTVAYFALVPRHAIVFKSGKALETSAFHEVKKLPKLAFDHSEIVRYALKRLRAKLEYTNVAYSLLPVNFTVGQLQKTYEIILGKKLDKRNFRKKFISLGLIRPTKKFLDGARHRPAQLYQFISRTPAELKKFF